ncbi:MAG: DUF523 and DUF1722 domain-containing protein [Nitrospira sp. SB0672_bin_25]|nr:DUF523 and DUF1722 domain-containing protein [Nitrospira sp. SB0666_bin_27]MYF24790.1 DUF523 and DUF1722 domain-containing protein [Nitrospira sp. SB0678_bin_10]MYJ54539.1 DUF523 and DUF1722 domain-containing protein [Nitrospira sp. SB0672_bin_25]
MPSHVTPEHLLPAEEPLGSDLPLRLGISRCLLGEPVRYDGGHKQNQFLVDVLGQHVEWVPVCPEVEAGFGTPREAMRLVDDVAEPRLLTVRSHHDYTGRMRRYAKTRVREFQALNLSGYVFKKDSPSCGTRRVRVYARDGRLLGTGKGLFAEAFQRAFPLTPIEEEGRLRDQGLRENFIERVFGYHRWQVLNARLTKGRLVAFHTVHKYLLLAHSQRHYRELGRLVANAKHHPVRELARTYGHLFMEALAVKTTIRKHVNVLQHLAGHFKNALSAKARTELHGVLSDYHHGFVPLSVPVALIGHYVRILDVPYVRDQVYLAPHPKELTLRNHV